MSLASDEYLLPLDEKESRGLNRQHRVWTKALDYLIHPSIEVSLPTNGRIADIATGTLAWILATAREFPESVEFVGFDISKRQFPVVGSAAKKITFETQDLLKPFPAYHRGTFDLVSLRLVASALAPEKWEIAARNLVSLLKPGGFAQWMEGDIEEHTPVQNTLQAPCESPLCLVKRLSLISGQPEKSPVAVADFFRPLGE